MSDDQLDNLLLGVDLDQKMDQKTKSVCKNCKSSNLVIDNSKGHRGVRRTLIITKQQ